MYPKDPYILFSYINTKLRNDFPSFEELCKSLSYDQADITKILDSAGFYYDINSNRFINK